MENDDVQASPEAPASGGVMPALHSRSARSLSGFWRAYSTRIIAGVTSVAITALIVVFRDRLIELSHYGYLGVFLISLLGNATVILPVPSLAAVFAGGSVLNPWLVGLCSGLGEPLGELTGYLAGYSGSAVAENSARYERIRGYMRNHGMLTVFALSAIPNPLFDLAGITAGVTHMPVWKFLLPCWLGKTIKGVAIAHLGLVAIDWVTDLLAR